MGLNLTDQTTFQEGWVKSQLPTWVSLPLPLTQPRIPRIMTAPIATKRTSQKATPEGAGIAKRQWSTLKGVPGIFSFPGLFRDQIGFGTKMKGHRWD